MKKALIFSLFAGIAAATLAQQAQTAPASSSPAMSPAAKEAINVARYKQALSEGRKQLFAVGMADLTPQQLEIFWAVYADYEKEKNAITSARVDLAKKYVDSYNTLADSEIAPLITESANLQKQNTDLRVKYFGIYSQKLNPRAAGHFALIDDYITTAARLALLDQLPLPQARK